MNSTTLATPRNPLARSFHQCHRRRLRHRARGLREFGGHRFPGGAVARRHRGANRLVDAGARRRHGTDVHRLVAAGTACPVVTAWSTPGAAMLDRQCGGLAVVGRHRRIRRVGGADGGRWASQVGFERIINRIPVRARRQACWAGVLLRFGLEAFAAMRNATRDGARNVRACICSRADFRPAMPSS